MSRHFLILIALLATAAHAQDNVGWAESSKPNNLGGVGMLGVEDSAQPTSSQAQVKQQTDDAQKATQPAAAAADGEAKTLSGISILGNQEAPKSLVIVPWKSSQIGDMPGLTRLLDDGLQPVDKDVFMRELAYYQIRSNSQSSSP